MAGMTLCASVATAAAAGSDQPSSATPTWTSVGASGGGWIMTSAPSPYGVDKILLGGDIEGIFASDDGGRSWSIRNEGLRDYWIETILHHPTNENIIYACGKSGVYKSTGRGATWQWLRTGLPPVSPNSYSAPVIELVMDPADVNVIYAGIGSPRNGIGMQGAVYRTVDGGSTWARVNAPGSLPADALITSLECHPTARTLYLSSQYGVFVSTDGGVTWTRPTPGCRTATSHVWW